MATMLSPSARALLEELEGELSSGRNEKPRQVLRAMPTQVLSDIDQVFEETRQRTEFKMSQVYQRTSICDERIKGIGESRHRLLHEQQQVANELSANVEQLREALAHQERLLHQQLADLVRLKEGQLDDQHNDMERRRNRLVDMYRESEEYMRDGASHKYEFIQRAHEMESKMDAHIALGLEIPELDLELARNVPYDVAQRAITALVFDSNSTGAPRPQQPKTDPVPSSQLTPAPSIRAAASPPVSSSNQSSPTKSPKDAVPNAVYVNGLSPDTTEDEIRTVFENFGDIKMVNARHVSNGGFAFVFFKTEHGAAAALDNPRVTVGDRTVNILAKKQILSGGGRWL